jgi:hypothetical protein
LSLITSGLYKTKFRLSVNWHLSPTLWVSCVICSRSSKYNLFVAYNPYATSINIKKLDFIFHEIPNISLSAIERRQTLKDLSQQQNIMHLKRTLMSLESQAQSTRKQLKQLLHQTEQRRCKVEIRWSDEQQAYVTTYFKNNFTLYSYCTKKSSRSRASEGIELANGLLPRVSWKDINAGKTWTADVLVHSWYWEEHFQNNNSLATVISLQSFRILKR